MIGIKKKEDIFYTLFYNFSKTIVGAAEAFNDLVNDCANLEEKAARMKEIETECDKECHKILAALNESFVTPFDREDIHNIATEMDDIVDSLEEVANRFFIFDIKFMRPDVDNLAMLALQATRELEIMFKYLPEIKKNNVVMDQIIEVNRLENEGDTIYRNALQALFKEETDPIELIKWKHLYDEIEEALDSCEEVANIIEGVVMKYA